MDRIASISTLRRGDNRRIRRIGAASLVRTVSAGALQGG